MEITNCLYGTWLFIFGVLILSHTFYPSPIEIILKATSLLNNALNISKLGPYADCIMLTIGITYIVAAIEIFHKKLCGQLLVLLVSLIMIALFDNPLFTNEKGFGKYVMVVCHLVNIGSAFSLGICCKEKESVKEPNIDKRGPERVAEIEENTEEKTSKKKKGKKK